MAYTDEELAYLLNGVQPQAQQPEVPAAPDVSWKTGKQLLNILPEAGNKIFQSAVSVFGKPYGADASDIEAAGHALPTFDVGPNTGIKDVILNNVAPEIASYILPYSGISRATTGILGTGRLASIAAEGIAQGGANYFTSARLDHGDPETSGEMGLASGLVSAALPRWQRFLPLAGISALAYAKSGNAFEAGANFLGNLLPGAVKATAPTIEAGAKGMADVENAMKTLLPHDPQFQPADLSGFGYHQNVTPPTPIAPQGTFNFLDQAGSVAPVGHELPLSAIPSAEAPASTLRLGGPDIQGEFGFMAPPEPPRTTLPDLWNEFGKPESAAPLHTPEAPLLGDATGIRLADAKMEQPTLHPLLDLQGEQPNPGAVNFQLIHPPESGPYLSGNTWERAGEPAHPELWDWRNNAVNQKGPLLLRDAEHPLSPSVEPPVHPTEPTPPVGPASPAPAPVEQNALQKANAQAALQTLHDAEAMKGSYKLRKAYQLDQGKMQAAHDQGLPYVRRAPGFSETGEYAVILPNGVKKGMYRDPENGWWYRSFDEGEKSQHYTERVLGFTKQEATDALMSKFGKSPESKLPTEEEISKALTESSTQAQNGNLAPSKTAQAITEGSAPAEFPNIMTPSGDFLNIQPRMEGPHIISTVLDEGEGQYLATHDWKAPHQNGPNSIFNQHIEMATGVGKSAFLIRDAEGTIRVTTDRAEALQIAKRAGQTTRDSGELHSQDLRDPVKEVEAPKPQLEPKAKRVAASKQVVQEKVNDVAALEAAKKVEARIQELQQDLKFAQEEGDTIAARGISAAIGKMRKAQQAQAGFITPEYAIVLTAAGLSGLAAYTYSKHDIGTTLAAGVIVALLGAKGLNAIKTLKEIRGPEAKIDLSPVMKAKNKLTQLAIETTHTPAGLAVGGRAGVWGGATNMAEGLLGMNQTEALKSAKLKADGFIALKVEELQKAFDAIKKVKPTEAFQEAEGKFLRGQLADPVEVQNILNSGGSVMSDAYNSMSAVDKARYPEKWIQLADPNSTNTTGPGVDIWHVTNATKQKLMQSQRDALSRAATTPEDLAYMQFPLKFREVTDTVMQMYHDALPPGMNRNKLVGTTGQYITRNHAVITDPKAYPDEPTIQRAMDRLGVLKEGDFLKNKEATTAPTATNTAAITWHGNTYYVSPRDAQDFKYLHSPESLRGEVRDYIKEIKDLTNLKKLGGIDPDSEQFSSSLFSGRKELDEVTQALLGTHQAPYQMMQDTLNKIMPAGQVASFIKDASRAINPSTGLREALTTTEYNQAIEAARAAMGTDVAARNRYNELLAYTKNAKNDRLGLTADLYVSRGLSQRLEGFDGAPYGFLDNAVGRGLQTFNSIFKTTHLALAPSSIARQVVQAPLMMAMGGVRDFDAIANGFKGFMDRSSPMGKFMQEYGVFSSSAAHGDFNHSLTDFLSGEMDKSLWGMVQRGVANMHKKFAAADDVVRASVFMNAAKREAAKLGVPLDSFDPRVGEAAQKFMMRRAMDFSNLPDYVKIGKNIPFVNIFLAYSHEIARVAKNMAVDAAHGDLQAGATLAGMTTIPFILQKYAEDNLSPEDREAWKKAQALAPAYSRPRFKLPMGRNANGSFNYLDITSILPFNDYQMMSRSLMNRDAESFAATNPLVGLDNSPIFNVIGPQIAGHDFHTQREFRGMGDRVKNALQQVLPGWTPGIGTEYIKSTPEELGGQLGVTNLKNARTNTTIGAFLRNLTGIDYTQVSPNIAAKNFVSSAKQDIANERAYLMDVLKSDISADAKKRAVDKFVESVHEITATMQEKLQLSPDTL